MQQPNLSVNDLLLLIGELYAERRSLQQQIVNLTAVVQRLQRQLDEAQRSGGPEVTPVIDGAGHRNRE